MKQIKIELRKPLLKVMFSLLLTSVGAVAQDGLLVHLKLDEAGGESAKDSSGNGHDGTLVGVPVANNQWVEGEIRQCSLPRRRAHGGNGSAGNDLDHLGCMGPP